MSARARGRGRRGSSWYRDSSGRIVTNWPGYMREYEERTRQIEPADYVFH